MPRDAVSRTANVERNGGNKWVKLLVTASQTTGNSCPRDWRFSPTWGCRDAPLKPFKQHSTIVSRVLRGAVNWVPIMPRDASLSDSRCNFLQSRRYRSHRMQRKKSNKNTCQRRAPTELRFIVFSCLLNQFLNFWNELKYAINVTLLTSINFS